MNTSNDSQEPTTRQPPVGWAPGALALCFIAAAISLPACGDDTSPEETITLEEETELFPSLDLQTGLMPPGSPVQAAFGLTAHGVARVRADAIASGSAEDPRLTGVVDTGSLVIEGELGLTGELSIQLDGLPSYQGPIPGIENVAIPLAGETTFDPFAIGSSVVVRADMPAAGLPSIPLPPPIPGRLELAVAPGSYLEVAFNGTCAGIDDDEAILRGLIARGGALAIQPTIVVSVPIVGDQAFPLPVVAMDLGAVLGDSELQASASVKAYGSEPPKGDTVTGGCSGGGDAGAGGQGGAGTAAGGAASSGVGGGDSGAGAAGPSAICAAEPSFTACYDCLLETNPTGYEHYMMAVTDQCFCDNECAAACTAECVSPTELSGGCVDCVHTLAADSACVVGSEAQCLQTSDSCEQYMWTYRNICFGK